jgi:hypothetical protein
MAAGLARWRCRVGEAVATRVRRRWLAVAALALAPALLGVWLWRRALRFPPETVPEGAYLRIAHALGGGHPEASFAYLEEEAQHALYTLLDYGKRAAARIAAAYPEPERTRALAPYRAAAQAADAPALWAAMALERGWLRWLRRDLSGVAGVEIAGERATVVTARGTRYAFARRPNGIWGLTAFSATLAAEAERMARDWDLVRRAADDYERVGK